MSNKTLLFTEEVYQYLKSHSLRLSPVAQELFDETNQLKAGKMQTSPEQGQFMAWLIELIQAKKILEIGTFTGFGALMMASALPKDGQLITCDVMDKWLPIAKRFWEKAGLDNKITFRLGEALKTMNALINAGESQSFDFIFIDADKKNYSAYYELSLKLLRKGGVIAVDNVLWSGRVASSDNNSSTVAIRQLNQTILEDERVSISMLPIGDGLTLALKRENNG